MTSARLPLALLAAFALVLAWSGWAPHDAAPSTAGRQLARAAA